MLLKVLQIIASVATVATGVISLVRPTAVYGFTGLQFSGPRGITEIRAVLGAASIASQSPHRQAFLRLFADTPLRKGKRRYYDNCLYFFCLLMLTGNYKPYII